MTEWLHFLDLKYNHLSLYRRETEEDLTDERESNMTTEAEIWAMGPQGKEYGSYSKLNEVRDGISSEACRSATLTPWFGPVILTLDFRMVT